MNPMIQIVIISTLIYTLRDQPADGAVFRKTSGSESKLDLAVKVKPSMASLSHFGYVCCAKSVFLSVSLYRFRAVVPINKSPNSFHYMLPATSNGAARVYFNQPSLDPLAFGFELFSAV